ncbi:MAG: hypothetical protein AABZ06_03775 [Bdellovibrionota bacterium]
MKKILLVLCIIMFAGCNEYSSPGGIIKTSFLAVKKSNLEIFRSTLTGDALKKFGNQEGLEYFRKQFDGIVSFELFFIKDAFKEVIISEDEVLRFYGVDISDETGLEAFWNVTVECKVRLVPIRDPNYICRPPEVCHKPGGISQRKEITLCHISDISVL